MATMAAVGEVARLHGFALAGVAVLAAEDAAAARAAWARLDGDVAVVILTPAAARAVADLVEESSDGPFPVVLPE